MFQAVDGGVEVTVLDEKQLAEMGCGGILGVGGGSAAPPRLVEIAYTPKDAVGHIALVGKGITYDSGGLTIKPGGSMATMKSDMAGAAAVVQATLLAARLELPVRISAFVPMAENMVSGTAMRPGDVLAIYGGTTVEVSNTDAEGRLVLADALVRATEVQPDAIIDVATLTGHMVMALGGGYGLDVLDDLNPIGAVIKAFNNALTLARSTLDDELGGILKQIVNSNFDSRDALAQQITHRGARITTTPLGHVTGHPALLQVLLQNLLSNALKFVEAGRAPDVEFSRHDDGEAPGGSEHQRRDRQQRHATQQHLEAADAVDEESRARLPGARHDEEHRHRKAHLREGQAELRHQPREQRRDQEVKEVRRAVRKAHERNDGRVFAEAGGGGGSSTAVGGGGSLPSARMVSTKTCLQYLCSPSICCGVFTTKPWNTKGVSVHGRSSS